MIDRPIFLDDAKSGFNTPVGIQNENIGGWNWSLSSPLTIGPPPVIGRRHFRPVTDRLLNGRLPGF